MSVMREWPLIEATEIEVGDLLITSEGSFLVSKVVTSEDSKAIFVTGSYMAAKAGFGGICPSGTITMIPGESLPGSAGHLP